MALNTDSGDARPAPRWEGIDGGRSTTGNSGLWSPYMGFHHWGFNWACHAPLYDETGDGIFTGGGAEEDSMAARPNLVHTVADWAEIYVRTLVVLANAYKYSWKVRVQPGMYWIVTGNAGSPRTEAATTALQTVIHNLGSGQILLTNVFFVDN